MFCVGEEKTGYFAMLCCYHTSQRGQWQIRISWHSPSCRFCTKWGRDDTEVISFNLHVLSSWLSSRPWTKQQNQECRGNLYPGISFFSMPNLACLMFFDLRVTMIVIDILSQILKSMSIMPLYFFLVREESLSSKSCLCGMGWFPNWLHNCPLPPPATGHSSTVRIL